MPDDFGSKWSTGGAAPPARSQWSDPRPEQVEAVRIADQANAGRVKKRNDVFEDEIARLVEESKHYSMPGEDSESFARRGVPKYRARLKEAIPDLPDDTLEAETEQFRQHAPRLVQARRLEEATQGARATPENWGLPADIPKDATPEEYYKERNKGLTTLQEYVLDKLPLVGHAFRYTVSLANREAMERFEKGEATSGDISVLANDAIFQERQKGRSFSRQLADQVAALPAVLTEWSMLSGPAGYLGEAAGAGTKALGGGRLLQGAAKIGTEGVARTALRPDQLVMDAQDQGLGKAVGSKLIENTVWSAAGGPGGGLVTGGVVKPLAAAQVNAELQKRLAGQGQGSLITQIINAKNEEELQAVLKAFGVEATVFAGLGGAHALKAGAKSLGGTEAEFQSRRAAVLDKLRDPERQEPGGEARIGLAPFNPQAPLPEGADTAPLPSWTKRRLAPSTGTVPAPGKLPDHVIAASNALVKGGMSEEPLKGLTPEERQQAIDRATAISKTALTIIKRVPQEPPVSGPPADEPGTGLINPVQSGVPGIVSGAVEVPLEKPKASTGTVLSPEQRQAWDEYQKNVPLAESEAARRAKGLAGGNPAPSEAPSEAPSVAAEGAPNHPAPELGPEVSAAPEPPTGQPAKAGVSTGTAKVPTAKMTSDDLHQQLVDDKVVGGLDTREWAVLRARHMDPDKTFEDIGKQLGVSKQRAQQIHEDALQKLAPLVEPAPPASEGETEGETMLPERGDLRTRKSANATSVVEDRYERALEELANQAQKESEEANGKLHPERIDWFNSEGTALADEQSRGKTTGPALRRAIARRKQGVPPGGNEAPVQREAGPADAGTGPGPGGRAAPQGTGGDTGEPASATAERGEAGSRELKAGDTISVPGLRGVHKPYTATVEKVNTDGTLTIMSHGEYGQRLHYFNPERYADEGGIQKVGDSQAGSGVVEQSRQALQKYGFSRDDILQMEKDNAGAIAELRPGEKWSDRLERNLGMLERGTDEANPEIGNEYQMVKDHLQKIIAGQHELRPTVPQATLERLKAMVASGDRVAVEDLEAALNKHGFLPEQIAEAKAQAGKFPTGVVGPTAKSKARGTPRQAEGGSRKWEAEQLLLDEMHAEATGREQGHGEDQGGSTEPTEVEPGVYFNIAGQGAKAASGQGSAGPGKFNIIASQNKWLNGVNYVVKKVPGNKQAAAAAFTDQQAILTSKQHADDPTVNLEEHSHNLAKHLGLETDPAKLPADVVEGFRQYVNPALPPNMVTPRVMVEGFGQWVVNRALGHGQVGTPAQQAAGKFGEAWLVKEGLKEPMDRVKALYDQYQKQTKTQQYQGGISDTGKPAEAAGTTRGERIGDTLRDIADGVRRRVDDDLHDRTRLEEHSAAMGNPEPRPGTAPHEVAQALRRGGQTYAADWQAHGFPEIKADGSMKPVAKGYDEATKRLLPGEEGKFNAYAKARADVTDFQIEQMQAAQAKAAGQKAEPPTVTQRQHDEGQGVLRELRAADPQQFQRFVDTHRDLIDGSNAGNRLLAQVGVFTIPGVEQTIRDHPDYTPRDRVFDEMTGGELPPSTGGRAGTPGHMKSRGLTTEQTRPALETFKERYGKVARLFAKQMMDQPVAAMLDGQGMGKFGRRMLEERPDPNNPSKTLPAEPDDPTKHVWMTRENGKQVRFMIADNALFDHLRGEPLQKTTSVALAEALSKIPVVNQVPKLIRLGAVALAFPWHLKDMWYKREPMQFAQGSVNPKSVGDVYAWYRHWPQFLATGKVPDGVAAKPYVELYERLAGDSQLRLTQGGDTGYTGWLKEVVRRLSYPEAVPRAVEMKNVLDKMGVDAATVENWNRTGTLPPVDLQVQLNNTAGEVTHAYMRKGADIRAWERTIPFLGAHVANTSKYLRNWKDHPGRMAGLLAANLATVAAYAYLKRDDQDYQEEPVEGRGKQRFGAKGYDIGLPGARGFDAIWEGIVDEGTRMATGANPHPLDRLGHDVKEQVVPNAPEPYSTGVRLAMNRKMLSSDMPIVPHGEDQDWLGKSTLKYRLPFAEQSLTGSAGGNMIRGGSEVWEGNTASGLNRGLNPLYIAPHPHQSITDFYDELHKAEAIEHQRKRAAELGIKGPDAHPRLAALRGTEKLLAEQSKLLHKDPKQLDTVLKEKIRLARKALGRDKTSTGTTGGK